MKIAPLLTAAAFTCGLATATPAHADLKYADIVFKVKVQVTGNIAAIDTGIDAECQIAFFDDLDTPSILTKRINILPVGQVFVPEANGYIERDLLVKNYGFDPENALASAFRYEFSCKAMPANGAQGFTAYSSATNSTVAVAPADSGTCDRVRGGFSAEGVPGVGTPSCAP